MNKKEGKKEEDGIENISKRRIKTEIEKKRKSRQEGDREVDKKRKRGGGGKKKRRCKCTVDVSSISLKQFISETLHVPSTTIN